MAWAMAPRPRCVAGGRIAWGNGEESCPRTRRLLPSSNPAVGRRSIAKKHPALPQYNAVSGAVSLVSIGQDVQRQLKSGTITEEQAAQLMIQHAEKSLAALWKINVMDIEKTLELVCMTVLQDTRELGHAGIFC